MPFWNCKKSSSSKLQEADELRSKYSVVLEQAAGVLASETLLPASKTQIKDALVYLSRHAIALGASLESLEPLKLGYAHLADFVSEETAGERNQLDGLMMDDVSTLDDMDVLAMARQMANSDVAGTAKRSTEEFAKLLAEFEERVSQ